MLSAGQSDERRPQIVVLDTFTNNLICTINGIPLDMGSKVDCQFTPDSNLVLSGGSDGYLRAYRTNTGELVSKQ